MLCGIVFTVFLLLFFVLSLDDLPSQPASTIVNCLFDSLTVAFIACEYAVGRSHFVCACVSEVPRGRKKFSFLVLRGFPYFFLLLLSFFSPLDVSLCLYQPPPFLCEPFSFFSPKRGGPLLSSISSQQNLFSPKHVFHFFTSPALTCPQFFIQTFFVYMTAKEKTQWKYIMGCCYKINLMI